MCKSGRRGSTEISTVCRQSEIFLKKVLPTSTHPYGIKAALSKKKKDVFSVSAASAPCLLKSSLHSDVRGAAWRKELELVWHELPPGRQLKKYGSRVENVCWAISHLPPLDKWVVFHLTDWAGPRTQTCFCSGHIRFMWYGLNHSTKIQWIRGKELQQLRHLHRIKKKKSKLESMLLL